MKKETVEKILKDIEIGYDLVADKFSETRKHFWRGLEFIGEYAKDGDTVLDFGCGNGRLLELFPNKKIKYFGVDVSEKLINLAKNRYSREFIKINSGQASLTFPDNYFNTVYSIAVFHHLPGKDHREKIAKELYRVTNPGGHIIITTWNLWPVSLRQAVFFASRGGQKKYFVNILRNWKEKLLGKSSLDWNDCYISFKDNWGNSFNRFHHSFTKKEVENLFSRAGFQKEKCKIVSGRNIIYIGRKFTPTPIVNAKN